jgi:hypothetical protein
MVVVAAPDCGWKGVGRILGRRGKMKKHMGGLYFRFPFFFLKWVNPYVSSVRTRWAKNVSM